MKIVGEDNTEDLNIDRSDSTTVSENGEMNMTGHALGINIPNGFNDGIYDRLSKLELGLHTSDFIQAWNGVVYRLRAAVDAESTYATHENEIDHEAKYKKASTFFSFFVAALSTIECYYFALYSIGTGLEPNIFYLGSDEKSKRDITPTRTRDAYNQLDATCNLAKRLDGLVKSSDYKELCDIRNYLAHQGNPSTSYRVGFGGSSEIRGQSATIKSHIVEYDVNTIKARATWLINNLNDLLIDTEEVCIRHKLKYHA